MNLSDMQAKEIVSVIDGRKLGRIVDVHIDIEDGKIHYFVAEQRHFFKRLFGKENETKFTFANIEKIGEDVILVKLWYNFLRDAIWIKRFYLYRQLFLL